MQEAFNCHLNFRPKKNWGQAIYRQNYNQKHSMVQCTSWQQVCSWDGFLSIAMTFKLLEKGQNLLVHHWHSNEPFLSWDWMLAVVSANGHQKSLLIPDTGYIKKRFETLMHLDLRPLTIQNSTYSLLHSVSVKRKIKCTLCSNVSTWDETPDAASQKI